MVLNRHGAMQLLGLDAECYEELLNVMRGEVVEWLEFFQQADRCEPEALRTRAHRLKSDAANIGAERVRHAARVLEQAIRDKQQADEVEHFRRLLVLELRELERAIA
jgi:HPt (histidine-containing phosphotransfer) domain-containing protein